MRLFGLEVEFEGSRDELQRQMELYNIPCQNIGRYYGHSETHWMIKTDGSVSSGGELVSPPLDFDNPEVREQVTLAIRAMQDARCRPAESAGIHVHVDARDLNHRQVAAVGRCFVKFEDVIYRVASSGWRNMRSAARTYAKPLREDQIQGLAKARTETQLRKAYYGPGMGMTASHGDSSRYCGLNIHSWFYRGTIEFRVFNSSVNPERVQAYIAMCVAMVQDARNGKARSVNKSYRLGGMYSGTTNADNAWHRFLQVLRYEAGMSLEDMKRLQKVWKDSIPQPDFVNDLYARN